MLDFPYRVREGAEGLRANLRQWRADLREDPATLWRTPAVRIVLWIVIGFAAYCGLRATLAVVAPETSGPPGLYEPTREATLYVACTNPACLDSYTTKQAMDFAQWPLRCRTCGEPTVYRASICASCRRWYAVVPGRPDSCPHCLKRESAQPTDEPRPEVLDPDDREDDW